MEYDFSSYENKTQDRLCELLQNNPPPHIREKIDALLADMNSLDFLGFKQGTDKASLIDNENEGVRLGHDYLRHYENFIGKYRQQPITILEFGCLKGQSLRMWEEYFPQSEIIGVDLDVMAEDHADERIKIVIGDVTERKIFDKIKGKLGGKRPFIILDDASHAWGDQRVCLEMFWHILAPSGFYIVEDLECGSMGAYPEFPPTIQDSLPFFNYVQNLCGLLRWSPRRRMGVVKNVVFEQLPELIKKIQISLDGCYFIPGAVILQKNPIKPPWEKD